MMLDEFLKDNLILHVGQVNSFFSYQEVFLQGVVICELIVDKPKLFVKVVLNNGGYIPHILWWDRVPVDTSSTIGGMGGPLDPRCPKTYYFSELAHLDVFFMKDTTEDEYSAHIEEMISRYPNNTLYIGFDIIKK